MIDVIMLLYLVIAMATVWMGLYFYSERNWIGLTIVLAFALRVSVGLVFETGLKYNFVLDSLRYEYYGWNLARAWSTSVPVFYGIETETAFLGWYEYYLGGLYYVFGLTPILPMVLNAFYAAVTIYFIQKTYLDFFSSEQSEAEKKSVSLGLVIILSLYPSYIVWSATNIRDPMYFMCCVMFYYFFMKAFAKSSMLSLEARILSFVGLVFAWVTIHGVRDYMGSTILASFAFGLFMYVFCRNFGAKKSLLYLVLAALVGVYIWQWLFPDQVTDLLATMDLKRKSFSNAGTDDFAKSSFGLKRKFLSIEDVLYFIPYAWANYFLAPFPWKISSFLQVLAFIEACAVYVLIWPTFVGIRKVYRQASFETIVLLSALFVFVFFQALIISNIGTIFRHRTLIFLFLSIFTSIGVYEIRKKNRQTVL